MAREAHEETESGHCRREEKESSDIETCDHLWVFLQYTMDLPVLSRVAVVLVVRQGTQP